MSANPARQLRDGAGRTLCAPPPIQSESTRRVSGNESNEWPVGQDPQTDSGEGHGAPGAPHRHQRGAVAAIPGLGGTISACYGNSGTLRIVDAENGEGCKAAETAISWKDGINGKVASQASDANQAKG